MNILCIDVGNTQTHFAMVEKDRIRNHGTFPTAGFRENNPESFATRIAPLAETIDGCAYASVVPAANPALEAAAAPLSRTLFHLTHETCAGLPLQYPKPSEIGEDRLANAIAAQAFHGVPAVVLDLGTAVTLDIVTDAGYEGGLIAPGLEVMTRYLHQQTALLPVLQPGDLVDIEGAIGKSTVHAMRLGVSVGFSGMVDALLDRVLAELNRRGGPEPLVLATGGCTPNLTRDWKHKLRIVDHLTLIGLAAAFERAHPQPGNDKGN